MAIKKTALAQSIAVLLSAATCSLPALAQEAAPAPSAAPEGQVIDEVIAIGRQKATAFDVVGERLEQEVATDFLSAEAIARVGDSTVSLALRRVPGLTLVNDQFIYVRGLGERYSSVLLNGAQVPSPDLTRNVIPLDIFPAEIIQALSVQKGYSPEEPAAFGGGNIDIITRGIPNGPVFNMQIGSGTNSANDDDGLAYPGGHDDGIGKDDGTRAFPEPLVVGLQEYRGNVTPSNILGTLQGDGNYHFLSEAEAINRDLGISLNRDVEITPKSLGPDGSLELDLGSRWYLGDQDRWQFGAMGLVTYSNVWRNRERTERDLADPVNQVENKLRTINGVAATGIANFGISFGSDHQLTASSFYVRNSEDETAISTRTNANFQIAGGRQLRDYDIRYEQRELTVNQIRGHHVNGQDTQELSKFFDHDVIDGMVFDWYVSDAEAQTDIPNEIKFSGEDSVDPATGAVLQKSIRQSNSAADYRFSYLRDEVDSSGWDLMKPVNFEHVDVEISGGQDVAQKARSYTQTQFGLGTTTGAAAPILVGTPGEVFTDAHISNPMNGFILSAGGIGTESYLAAQTNLASYIKADALVNEKWRYAGGLRYEQFRQASLPIDTLEYNVSVGQCALSPCDVAALENATFSEDDVYPTIAVTRIMHDVWAQDFQLRFGLSNTVARPDLREIAGSTYIDPLTETRVRGNPALVTSAITNFDFRAEWFFDNGDNFTASLFYKDIKNPIETVQGAGTDDNISLTFINADAADISGIEVEWLKDLSTLGPKFLEPFFFSGNITLSDSEITVGDVGFNVTNDVRPMSQHSKYVANLQLGYDSNNGAHSFTIAYNTFGERLFFAGRDGVPDAYEQPFDSLDFTYSYYPTEHVSVKFRIQNLLDSKLEIEQGDVLVIEQNVGTTAKVDVKWNVK
jgi:TonB-dependent receptor